MKRYPEYKDSGVEWIGKVPRDWEVKKLKYLDNCVMGQSPAVRAPVGAVNIADQVYGIGRGLCAIRAKKSYKRYLYYRTYCLSEKLNSIATGSTYSAVSVEEVNNVLLPHPPYIEQKSIASYLDRKTAQIDELIAKKERMIELLEEERIAIINQAVTKGTPPAPSLKKEGGKEEVEMKDSGIEWLGKVPKHWEIKKIKYAASVRFSNVNKKSEDGEQSIRLCNYVDVYYNNFISSELNFMSATASSEEIRKFQLKAGDVIVTKDSEEWNDIAIPAYVVSEFQDVICGYHLAQIRSNEDLMIGKYLFWLLSADCINYQYKIEASGVTRFGLGNYALSNSIILIPPKKEQKEIISYLDCKNSQIDTQIAREKKSIDLLKEYRTALISEAVTGKIDIRDYPVKGDNKCHTV